MRRCLVKGSVLRSVACLPTHPVLPIAPSQRIYIIHRDLRIYMGIYMCRDIWEYVCVEERASEAPPAVVRRMCGCVGLYVWWRERESEREGEGRGRGGGGETTTTLRQNHSTSTAHQSIDTRSKTLSQQYPSEKIIGVGWIHQT